MCDSVLSILQGLYDIVLGKQPSFCVVSNGAEVIMIDKDFYSENLNERILKKIRNEVSQVGTTRRPIQNYITLIRTDA